LNKEWIILTTKKLPTLERLNEILDYDPETGVFRWKKPTANRVKVGAIAGTDHNLGYRIVMIDRSRYFAHRLAWKMHHGRDPEDQIDHINGIKNDNRIKNLRECSRAQNQCNRGKNKNNSSGYKGVSLCRRSGKYVAHLTVIGVKKYLGHHKTASEAHEAYKKAAKEYHGYFYNGGEK
jgi:hypothetical protein